MLHTIADALPSPTAEELFSWLKVVACFAALYLMGLKIYQGHRRQPPVEEDLRRIDEKVTQRFEAVRVSIMPRAEVESEVERLEAYTHDMRHEVKSELQSITLKIEEAGAETRQTIATLRSELEGRRSQGIAALHQQLKGAEVQIGAVAKEAELHTAQITQLDQKIDRMPERILTLLNSHKRS